MKKLAVLCMVCALVGVVSIGCKKKEEAPKGALPPGHPPTGQAGSPALPPGHPAPTGQAPAGTAITGKVVETMNASGYTYVLLENAGKKTWVALPDSKVKVGQQITCAPGMTMQNFQSKTLNRTFASIIFSEGIIK